MVNISPDFEGRAFHIPANAAHIGMQFGFNIGHNKWLSVLGAEHEVDVVFDERLSHGMLFLFSPKI